MPHLRFKGVSSQTVAKLSHSLPPDLAEIFQTEVENFSFECESTLHFSNGVEVKSTPYIEIHMFPRNADSMQSAASLVTKAIQKIESHDFVTIVFIEIQKSHYYENEKHF